MKTEVKMAYVIDKKATEMQKKCINEAIKVVNDLNIPVSKNIEFVFFGDWHLITVIVDRYQKISIL